MLHVTNGDAAADGIRALGLPGPVLPWRDVLHEGPVPAGLLLTELSATRARWMAEQGWGPADGVAREFAERDAVLARFAEHDELVLWFEHDLYDQLQLLQLLDWLAGHPEHGTRLSLIDADEYLGPAEADRLAALFQGRAGVSDAQLRLGCEGWAAFRGDDPTAIERFLADADLSPLPHLGPALRRHLEQFPGVADGLSRSERQALEVLADGPLPLGEAYRRSHHAREEAIFLGDTVFVLYLRDLSDAAHPLVTWADGGTIRPPRGTDAGPDFFTRPITLTDAGRDVLGGRADRVRLNGIDRWLGGVHLAGHDIGWRWDGEAGRLVAGPR